MPFGSLCLLAQADCVPTHVFSKNSLYRSPLLAMAAPATPADAWTDVEEFAAATDLRAIDGAAILVPVTTNANDDEAEIVVNVTRDDVYA